ncbi:MAG: hypothetical protein QXJ74_06775 [Nitrososphaera sp.]
MQQAQRNMIIVEGNIAFSKKSFTNEKELEQLVFKNRHLLFGQDAIYIDKKVPIFSEYDISSIVDGLVLTIPSSEDAKLWLLEVELERHRFDHIQGQILRFLQALENLETIRKLEKNVYDEIKNSSAKITLKDILPKETEIWDFVISVIGKGIGIVIVIDEISPKVNQFVSSIGRFTQTEILQFSKYESSKKQIYLMDILQSTSPPVYQIRKNASGMTVKLGRKKDVPLKELTEAVKKAIRSYNRREFEVKQIHDKIIKFPEISVELSKRPYLMERYEDWPVTRLYHRVEERIKRFKDQGKLRWVDEGKYRQVKEL